MCDKALAAVLEEFPCCSLKRMIQWVQPQPESLHANICVMKHTSIKSSSLSNNFSSCLFLASSHTEVHPQGSGVHWPTSRSQIHTPTSATSVLPLVAFVQGLLVLLGCRLFVVTLLLAKPDLQVAGRGMRCLRSASVASQPAARCVSIRVGMGDGFKGKTKVLCVARKC